MTNFKDDKKWSDRFLPEIKQILGFYLIGEPPIGEDMKRNTDLTVLKMDAVRVACRVRKYTYLQRYGNEFTIRSGRPSGVKTELQKIIEGWGDYVFYGFSDPTETYLASWALCDLNVFRGWYSSQLYAGFRPGFEKMNYDGSSSFVSFNFAELPQSFIIGRKIQ